MDNETTETTPTDGTPSSPAPEPTSGPTAVAVAAPEPLVIPSELWIDELHAEPVNELMQRANRMGLRPNADKTRHQVVVDLLRAYASRGTVLFADGIIEMSPQGGGFLRWPRYNFKALPQDVYLSPNLERQHFLRNGNHITARIRPPRDRERFISVEEILTIEEIPAAEWKETKPFDSLTALFPDHRIVLENPKSHSISGRAIDIIAPLGRGQRGLIVAPPRTGKTILLRDIAQSIIQNSPETKVILLLVDERPEEVTDFRRSLKNCEIYSSTFDESPQRHVQVAELVSDRAKRLVECRRHVVILLDSITRLARGYNNLQPNKGRIMSGGVDTKALVKPNKFFSAARNTEEGGSLTILASALVETNSRMDDVIFEEFKGKGNMELRLDRNLSDKRIFPAINIILSATRRDDLLYHPKELEKVNVVRKQLTALPPAEATEILIHALKNTASNAQLLLTGLRG